MPGHSRRSTVTGALWNVTAMVVPLVSTLLLSVVIGRRLGTSELGEQSLIAYVGSLVAGMLVISANTCATQMLATAYGADQPGRFAALARLSRGVHLAGGLVAAVVLAGIGSVRDHWLAWVFIGLVTWIDAFGWSHAGRLVALRGWRAVSPLRVISQIAGSLLSVGAVLLGGGLAGVFGAQLLSSAWLALVLRRRDRRLGGELDVRPEALALRPIAGTWTLFLLGVVLNQVVNKRVELIFLDAFRSPHVVAAYAVAYTVVGAAVTVPSSLAAGAMPGIAAAGAASAGSLPGHLRRATRMALLVGLVLASGLAALGPSAVLVLWGTPLAGAARLLPWLAVGALFVPVTELFSAYWTAVGRLVPVLLTGAAGAVVDLALAAGLVPPFGVAGAVTANVAAQCVWLALLVRYTRRQVPGVLPSVPVVLRAAVPAAVAGAAGWAAVTVVGSAGVLPGLLAGAVAFAAVLALFGATAGLVSAGDADWLAGALPARAEPLLVVVGGRGWSRGRRGVAAPDDAGSLARA